MERPHAGELLRAIEGLNTVGSVLYVAAHPDDENTRLLAWLVGDRGLDATYLSMTRGGGGQNLIGAEQSELLGVVRTGELLGARDIDGAEQLFTRSRDFGYSKSPEETLKFWGREDALADVVLAIRSIRPDVVITRFNAQGGGHGHHTASAQLAAEAFEAAGDPTRFPEQLDSVQPWRPDRLLYNQSHWRITEDTDTSGWLRLDVGSYDPARGLSWGEIAARSRSVHKSQGFGSAPRLGSQLEYFVPLAGTELKAPQSPLHGLDLSWGRFPGTKKLSGLLSKAARDFDPARPWAVLPTLAKAHAAMASVPDAHWRERKTAELERVMLACAGIRVFARAERPAVVPGGRVPVTASYIQRGGGAAELRALRVDHAEPRVGLTAPPSNEMLEVPVDVTLPEDMPLSIPHWLRERPSAAAYTIPEPALRIRAATPAALHASFDIVLAGVPITVATPVEYAWTDPVKGELRRDLEVLPPVTASFDHDVIMLPQDAAATTRVVLRAATDEGPRGALELRAPAGYEFEPARVSFDLSERGEQTVDLRITAAPGTPQAELSAVVIVDGREWSTRRDLIDYDHLPRQTILRPASLRLVPLDLKRGAVRRIGYLPGAGDRVAQALRQVGYEVEEIDEDVVAAGGLERFDAVVLGVRAYNTRPRLMHLHAELMAYVEQGGVLLAQYNTNNRFNPLKGPIGPRPFNITRDRVTEEDAPMTPVRPDHPVLVGPNPITEADFDAWVQERGLYFAGDWDARYETLFTAADTGSEPLEGSILLGQHGEGVFIYTGLSFFRQLPAGVPGAYRLLANLLDAGSAEP